jgi:signal transduction histidine kinase
VHSYFQIQKLASILMNRMHGICWSVTGSFNLSSILPTLLLITILSLSHTIQAKQFLNNESFTNYLVDPSVVIRISNEKYANAMDYQDLKSAAAALIELGNSYFIQGEYNIAEEMFSKSLTLNLKLKNPQGVTHSLLGLGDVNRKEKKFVIAKNIFSAALRIAESRNYNQELAQLYNRLGDINRHLLNYEFAEKDYLNSLYIARKYNYLIEIGNNCNNLGEVKRFQSKCAISREYYNQALFLAKSTGNNFGIVENQYGLACIDTAQGNMNSALIRLNEARNLAEKFHFREELKNVYALEAVIFEKQGDLSKALQIQKEFNELSEGLYLASLTLQNTQQRILNEIEQKNNELLEKNSTISKMSKMQIGLFIALILLLIGAAFLYQLNNQHKSDLIKIAKQSEKLSETIQYTDIQKKELEVSNDTRTKLLGLVSHDIRVPMYNSLALVEAMHDYKGDPKRMNEICVEVLSGLRITTQLIDNLLFWSRKNTSQIHAEFEILNLRTCIETEMKLFSIIAAQKKIAVSNEIPNNLNVYADSQLIRMTIRNLVMNSIKFTPDGGTISIHASRINGHTEVRVKDTGLGMNSEQIAHLFDEKHAFSTNGTHGEMGTGLGLMMVKEFVEKNKGVVNVESAPGQGSTFSFTLKPV